MILMGNHEPATPMYRSVPLAENGVRGEISTTEKSRKLRCLTTGHLAGGST